MDAPGRKLQEGRIDGNAVVAFEAYFKQFGAPSEVVIEACWNWVHYRMCSKTWTVSPRWCCPHPAKNRIIADAQIKNDRVDAKALAAPAG